jgi:hypothetical protein
VTARTDRLFDTLCEDKLHHNATKLIYTEMNSKKSYKESVVNECNRYLSSGVFPEETLKEIRDIRLRREVVRKVLYPSKGKQELTENEKITSKVRFNAFLQFEPYLRSFFELRIISEILFVIGILFGLTSFLGANTHIDLGILNIVLGTSLLILSFFRKLVKEIILYISIGFPLLFLAEVILFGIPINLFNVPAENVMDAPWAGVIVVVNQFVPYSYLVIKLLLVVFLYRIVWVHKKYVLAKEKFEIEYKKMKRFHT